MTSLDLLADRSDPTAQRIFDLVKPSRTSVRTVLVEDVEPLLQSIAAGVEFSDLYVLEGLEIPSELVKVAREKQVQIRFLESGLAGQIFKSEKKPKVFGVARMPRPARLIDLSALSNDIVVLDGVKIVGNIGAIIRTAFALGAAGVVLIDSDLVSVGDRRLVRASRGYVFSLPVVLASRQDAISYLEEKVFRPISFDANSSTGVERITDMEQRLALVFGGEKVGASDAVTATASDKVFIPMNPLAESLNVSVSAGIALHSRISKNLPADLR